MKLVIGGYANGKLDYVLGRPEAQAYRVYDGCLPEEAEWLEQVIIDHLNLWIKKQLEEQQNPEQRLDEFLKQCPDCILISDEIGNGIVPMDAFEREYREKTGRILIELAKQADEVVRVVCGIGQKLK
ncbi:MAG: bifunctional adenosylcobinamide kinase/adenosylcobinamide-phosphate guanylyltransferase [Lachnospiraceae bacterium]|nr:bifunctional adenosylcobinamide kinase/adenosylcobinamide-phosphate guanylyltransferase [Cuneatibacter sp.]MDD6457078.1 bifunctional adenosylcobinamide kinase/adenosylcobinamide-phosphate guanylyltransferase [Lachnospiraceae bacterium]